MLNDSIPEFQSIAIMPLINAGKFDIAFSKFKELIQENEKVVLINFYKKNSSGKFEEKKKEILMRHKDQFEPFLIKLCSKISVSNSIKFNAANTLFFLGKTQYLRPVCNNITASMNSKEPTEFTQEDIQLKNVIKFTLKQLSEQEKK